MDKSLDEVLEHHGVRGMKWGVRKSRSSSVPDGTVRVTQKASGGKVKLEGGRGIPAHPDAIRALHSRQVAEKSGLHALSNQDLQHLVSRMNLEQQYGRLRPSTNGEAAVKILSDVLGNVGKQQVSRVANDYASKQVGDLLKNKK